MALFSSSLISRFPGMLLKYFLNDFEMVSVAPIVTGTTFCTVAMFNIVGLQTVRVQCASV
jgi:hypothetical protein